MLTQLPRGTKDIYGPSMRVWHHVEEIIHEAARAFVFSEIRTPIFEHTELFLRGVGESTDVVQKEMYTFTDRGGDSLTLRPEMTAGVMRAVVEHGLYNDPLPVKLCYVATCYRYDKPQAGRFREHHQFGAECIGATEPSADAELMLLVARVLRRLGLRNAALQINSIGCPDCRPAYYEKLHAYFGAHLSELCPTCRERLARNPLRILDCKEPGCQRIAAGAPHMVDHLCGGCAEHFAGLRSLLDAAGQPYEIVPTIVRGLDYYTRTVFEFVSSDLGAQSTVCGGGRLDGLSEQLGGPSLPSVGFGMGIERLLLILDAQSEGAEPPAVPGPDLYIAPMGADAARDALRLCEAARDAGIAAVTDLVGRSVKAQMKYADRLGAAFALVLGERELLACRAALKLMRGGDPVDIPLDSGFVDTFLAAMDGQNAGGQT